MYSQFSKFLSKFKSVLAIFCFYTVNVLACITLSLIVIASNSDFKVMAKLMEILDGEVLKIYFTIFLAIVKIAVVKPILGCIFAQRKSRKMLIFYICMSAIMLLIQLILLSLLFCLNSDDIHKPIADAWTKIWEPRRENIFTINEIQNSLKCCGNELMDDYGNWLPSSCCGQGEGSYCDLSKSFKVGCKETIQTSGKGALKEMFFISFVISIFEVSRLSYHTRQKKTIIVYTTYPLLFLIKS